MARDVNAVWNWCGGAQEHAWKHGSKWPNHASLCKGLSGLSIETDITSDIFQRVAKQWCISRDKNKRRPKWRVSSGSRRSLGWIPFQAANRSIKISDKGVRFAGQIFKIWRHREIPKNILSGCFSEDATGRWYINLVCEIEPDKKESGPSVGIDLGLKDFAVLSDGIRISNPRHFNKSSSKLAQAQKYGKKVLAKKINRKIAAQRKDFLHKESAKIAKFYRFIAVGNVNSAALAKTKMAKSVFDAGWSAFRFMLCYKAIRHGAVFVEANERYSTQSCSSCGSREGSPKGVKDLGVRSWECKSCGILHDRDINAAINILASGRSAALQLTGNAALKC